MDGKTASAHRFEPAKFVSQTRSQSSTVVRANNASCVIPAQQTNRSGDLSSKYTETACGSHTSRSRRPGASTKYPALRNSRVMAAARSPSPPVTNTCLPITVTLCNDGGQGASRTCATTGEQHVNRFGIAWRICGKEVSKDAIPDGCAVSFTCFSSRGTPVATLWNPLFAGLFTP